MPFSTSIRLFLNGVYCMYAYVTQQLFFSTQGNCMYALKYFHVKCDTSNRAPAVAPRV